MRSIRVSDEVWQAIASNGKFGETEDDVLKRVFGLDELSSGKEATSHSSVSPNAGFATVAMRQSIRGEVLSVSFETGQEATFHLPKKMDVESIRRVRREAILWARANGASAGQEDAIKKELTTAGYYLRGPRT